MVALADRLLTIEQIAELLTVDPHTVRRWLRLGELRGIALGGKAGWRVPESELQAFLERRMR